MSTSSSPTTEKETSLLWTSHRNQALSSSPSSSASSSSSSVTVGTETSLLLSSQLHQGLLSSLESPSLSPPPPSSSSSSSLSPLSSSTSSKTITMASLLLQPSHLYQGVLPPSSSLTGLLSRSQEFPPPSSTTTGETPGIVTTLQNEGHSSSTLALETAFSEKNRFLSASTKIEIEIAKSCTANDTPILSSLLATSKTRVSPLPSQQSVYLSLSKQDISSTGKFTSRDKTKALTLDLVKSTTSLSVPTNTVSSITDMLAVRSSVSSSTLPVREEIVSSVRSPISLPITSPSVHLPMASLEPSKLPSSSTSSLIKTESSLPSDSLFPATSLKNVGGQIKPTNSLSLQHLSTDVNSGSSRYLSMSLSPSPSSLASSSILLAPFTIGSSVSLSSTAATTLLSSLSSSSSLLSSSSKLFAHSVAFTSRPSSTTTATASSTSSSAILSPPPAFSSLHDYQSSFLLVTSTLSHLLKSTITSASPTPSLPIAHSLLQSLGSVSPSKHIPDATTSLNTKISISHEGKNIDNKTVQSSRKSQFIVATAVLSGQQTKASMVQKTPDLSSINLSTGFNGPSISHGSFIKRILWTPSTKPLSSQTETSTAMLTNTPLDELNQTLSIVSSTNVFPHTHHAKRHEGISSKSAPTSAPNQLVGLTVDSSRKVNFIKTAETQPTLMKTSPTAVFKPKGINTKFRTNPSLVIKDSRTSETGTHGLHTKELASSKDAMSMRGSLTTTEMGKPMASRILVSTVTPDIPRPTRTPRTFLRKETKGAITLTSSTSTFSTRFDAFPKSSSFDYERHSTLQNVVTIFSKQQEKIALTRSSATFMSSTFTSDGFPDVSKSASKETRSEPLGNPQDSTATADAEMPDSPFTPTMAFHSISPTSTLYTFPSSTSITDGNISMVTTSDGTNTGTKSTDDPNNKILLFIIIAIIPTLLLLILIAIFLFRRAKERESEPFYKIQVEYTDDNKQRRPRCANSRLDLTIKGMHIDLEFPSPGEKRKSARLSAPPNLSDAQMRELQKLSLECKENLEWINEVLERELDTPVFGGSSSSENDDSMDASCTNQRHSVYSACSEKEKENYEVSEKIIVRDSPKRTKYKEDETDRKSCLQIERAGGDNDETSKDDSDELKIKLDQRTSPKPPRKPQKPEIPPKPKIKLTATDGMGTLVNPLTSTIFIECSANDDERKGKNKFDPVLSKNSTPKERTLLKKPPIPEKKGIFSRKPEKTLRKPELSLTPKNEAKESPCLCNRLSTSKPPIPKKPDGLVINRFERKANDGTSGRVTTTLYRSGMKLNVCCAPRKACQAV